MELLAVIILSLLMWNGGFVMISVIMDQLAIKKMKDRLDDNKDYYVYNLQFVYESECDLKEDNIDDYIGLDDGMSDWLPEHEVMSGKELKQIIDTDFELMFDLEFWQE